MIQGRDGFWNAMSICDMAKGEILNGRGITHNPKGFFLIEEISKMNLCRVKTKMKSSQDQKSRLRRVPKIFVIKVLRRRGFKIFFK